MAIEKVGWQGTSTSVHPILYSPTYASVNLTVNELSCPIAGDQSPMSHPAGLQMYVH